ncbi:MAG TPA: FAD-dependent oxidoreductase [Terriglobales bacterium]|jgi:glycerol-3-phosphate dehydrogenase
MTPLSPNRAPLEGERFQVIVIGGGANGVAIARECARSGRRTLLLEQSDFASGSTSRSSRIVPGGLRHVEQKNLGAARDLLRDQNGLLKSARNHVQAMEFLLALSPDSRRSNLKVKSALWLYRQMQTSHLPAGARTNAGVLQQILPGGKRWSIFSYEDALCAFPERLVAAWLADSVEASAVVRNYTQALAVDVRHGRAQGVLLRDQLSGREERIGATWVINATGPWAERLCQRSRVQPRVPILSTIRSTYIALPAIAGAPDSAISFEGPNGQPLFLLPWNSQLLVGPVETADRGDPSKIAASSQDVDILLDALQRVLPALQVSRQDIRFAFTGLFAKPAGDGDAQGYAIHDHALHGASNLFSIVGGTLTSALRIARETTAKLGSIQPHAEIEHAADSTLDNWIMEIRDAARINEESAAAIAEWHGERSANIVQLAEGDARMRAPLCSHSEHIVAEAANAYRNEFAITLGDVLLRRVPVALGACWSQACGREAVTRIRAVMGWTEEQAAAELEAFEMERSALLLKPRPTRAMALQTAAD